VRSPTNQLSDVELTQEDTAPRDHLGHADHGWSVDGQLLLTTVTAIHVQRLNHVYKEKEKDDPNCVSICRQSNI